MALTSFISAWFQALSYCVYHGSPVKRRVIALRGEHQRGHIRTSRRQFGEFYAVQQNEDRFVESIRIGQFHPLREAHIQRRRRQQKDYRIGLPNLSLKATSDIAFVTGLVTPISPDRGPKVRQNAFNRKL